MGFPLSGGMHPARKKEQARVPPQKNFRTFAARVKSGAPNLRGCRRPSTPSCRASCASSRAQWRRRQRHGETSRPTPLLRSVTFRRGPWSSVFAPRGNFAERWHDVEPSLRASIGWRPGRKSHKTRGPETQPLADPSREKTVAELGRTMFWRSRVTVYGESGRGAARRGRHSASGFSAQGGGGAPKKRAPRAGALRAAAPGRTCAAAVPIRGAGAEKRGRPATRDLGFSRTLSQGWILVLVVGGGVNLPDAGGIPRKSWRPPTIPG